MSSCYSRLAATLGICLLPFISFAQIIINEGSNRNFNTILDEDQEAEDWIELYNAGDAAVNLEGYTMTDNSAEPNQWTFTSYELQPQEFIIVFLSGKNRFYFSPFQQVNYTTDYTPTTGWNTHTFNAPFACQRALCLGWRFGYCYQYVRL